MGAEAVVRQPGFGRLHSNLCHADVSIPTSFPPHWAPDLCQHSKTNVSDSAAAFQNKSPKSMPV